MQRAVSAVEFPRALFHEASQVEIENPKGVMKMKLVRYGAMGQEKPGLIDKSGQLRDLSAHVKDLDGEAYAPASLAKLAAPRRRPSFPPSTASRASARRSPASRNSSPSA